MRLLNVGTLQLESFETGFVPAYAILSHCWEEDEVTTLDIVGGKTTHLKGYAKIVQCCIKAEDAGLRYVWVDTCCIDKSSSAELSEAINSMYQWYQMAAECYVYLSDVTDEPELQFRRSRWFTRGWTLQELLAPQRVTFFSHTWQVLGDKIQLCNRICEATGIPEKAVLDFNPNEYCVAQRMSWASHRRTARVEDQAYSLLGIFEINMPMLYGEGDRAFIKLQEEIMRTSKDHSIFAFNGVSDPAFGLLAASPSSFATSRDIGRGSFDYMGEPQNEGFTISNAGVSIMLDLRPWFLDGYIALLDNCMRRETHGSSSPRNSAVGIILKRSHRTGQYRRVALDGLNIFDFDRGQLKKLPSGRREGYTALISRCPLEKVSSQGLDFGFHVKYIDPGVTDLFDNGEGNPVDAIDTQQQAPEILLIGRKMDDSNKITISMGTTDVVGMIQIRSHESKMIMLHFAFDFFFNPICLVSRFDIASSTHRMEDLMIKHGLGYKGSRERISVADSTAILQLMYETQKDTNYRPSLQISGLQFLEDTSPDYKRSGSGACHIDNDIWLYFSRNETGYNVGIYKDYDEASGSSNDAYLPEFPLWEYQVWKDPDEVSD